MLSPLLSLTPSLLRVATLCCVAGCVALTHGCVAYRFGNQSLYRPDIKTIFVPMFRSDSFRPFLGERLTEAVIKEIELKTPYKVVSDPNADSVLTGRITYERKRVLAEDANDNPRDLDTELIVEIQWYDRLGGVILESSTLAYSPRLFSTLQNANFVPESGQSIATAHQESVQRLAEQIVAEMEMPW